MDFSMDQDAFLNDPASVRNDDQILMQDSVIIFLSLMNGM